MAVVMRQYDTARIARWRRHRTSTRSDSVNRSSQCRLFLRFHHEKGLELTLAPSNNNKGVTYQSDRKELADGVEYLNRGAKLVS
jgi:hypothetical protein